MSENAQIDERGAGGSTSRSLLRDLRGSDGAAWERLVTLYAPLIVSWCRRSGVPGQDIPDVFQDVLRTLSQSIDQFRRDRPTDTFRGWLRRITLTRTADYFRRRSREPQAAGGTDAQMWLQQFATQETTEGERGPPDEVFGHVLAEALSAIRGEFHQSTWQAFWAVAVQGRTPNDVGSELGMRPGTVRVAKSRVLQRLRRELGDIDDGGVGDSPTG